MRRDRRRGRSYASPQLYRLGSFPSDSASTQETVPPPSALRAAEQRAGGLLLSPHLARFPLGLCTPFVVQPAFTVCRPSSVVMIPRCFATRPRRSCFPLPAPNGRSARPIEMLPSTSFQLTTPPIFLTRETGSRRYSTRRWESSSSARQERLGNAALEVWR
jgi:hypothetical protein